MPRHNDDHTGEDIKFNKEVREKLIEHFRVMGDTIRLGKGQDHVITRIVDGKEEKMLLKCLNVRCKDLYQTPVVAMEVALLEKNSLKSKPIALSRRKIDTVVLGLNFEDKLVYLFFTKEQYMKLIEERSKNAEITNTRLKCYNNENPATICCQTGCNTLKRATRNKDANRILSRFEIKELMQASLWYRTVVSKPVKVNRRREKPLPTCF